MNGSEKAAILVAVMAAVTMLLRFLPFLLFRKRIPQTIVYLGQVLPPAIMGMLVVYCLRDIRLTEAPFGAAEIVAGLIVVSLQAWKSNSLLSILTGTGVYMLLIQTVF